MSKDIKFPSYLYVGKEKIYSIQGYIDDTTDYIAGKGYIERETGHIYIYADDSDSYHNIPHFVIENGEVVFKYSEDFDVFNIDNATSYSIKEICDVTTGDEILYNEEALRDMNASTSVYSPTINETDDFLKKSIKHTITSLNKDVNSFKHKLPNKYGITNLKSSLNGTTKTSVPVFLTWAELLGIRFKLTVYDKATDKEVFIYDSSTDKIIDTNEE